MYLFSKDNPSLISLMLETIKSINFPNSTKMVILAPISTQFDSIKIMNIIGFVNRWPRYQCLNDFFFSVDDWGIEESLIDLVIILLGLMDFS